MARPNRASQVWSLTSDRHTLTCIFEQHGTPFSVIVKIDGAEIAARSYPTRAEAVGYAVFLFDRLTDAGWAVRSPITEQVLH